MSQSSPTRAQQSPGHGVLAQLWPQPPSPPAQCVCPFPRLTVQESTRAQKKETSQHKSRCKNAEISSLRIRVRGLDYYYYYHLFFFFLNLLLSGNKNNSLQLPSTPVMHGQSSLSWPVGDAASPAGAALSHLHFLHWAMRQGRLYLLQSLPSHP